MGRTDRERRPGTPGEGIARRFATRGRGRRDRRLTGVVAALGALLLVLVAVPAALALPDARQWEQVSPPDKHGAQINPADAGIRAPVGGIAQASEDGNGLAFTSNAPFEAEAPSNRAPEGIEGLATRSPSGWSSQDIATPADHAEGFPGASPQEYRRFSPDLALSLVEPFGLPENPFQEPALVPGTENEQRSIYLRHDATCTSEPATCFEALVTAANNRGLSKGQPTVFGGKVIVEGTSPDLQHVAFFSSVALTPNAPKAGGVYEWNAGKPADEALQYVAIQPGEKESPEPESGLGAKEGQGEGDKNARNAVSSDGTRLFWSGARGANVSHLYMRDTAKGVTLQVNAPQGVNATASAANVVRYQTATPNGSRVFFTDTAPLNLQSHQERSEEAPPDLYVCEILEGGGGPECGLTDLSPASGVKVSGEVLGVIGSDDAGNVVYFVANHALAEGAVTGNCGIGGGNPEGRCNLYSVKYDEEEHKWGAPKLVAVLSGADASNWSYGQISPTRLTAGVSHNGRFMAFTSQLPLTGYDNTDAHSGKPDTEVFLYDAEKETLVCPSCNSNPEHRPTGVFDTKEAGEAEGLVTDPGAELYKEEWVAGTLPGYTPLSIHEAPYQSRYLLDSGRLYFNSTDALVPEDTNHRAETVEGEEVEVGVSDVYQYEPEGVGSCALPAGCVALLSSGTAEHESAFMDASANGSDAFFLTSQPLLASDIDPVFDAYDARECTTESPCIPAPKPPPPPCAGEVECRVSRPPTPPTYEAPVSETFHGPGNKGTTSVITEKVEKKVETRAQKLKKALTSCRKRFKHSKHKRAACERTARAKYGPKKPTKKSTKAAHRK